MFVDVVVVDVANVANDVDVVKITCFLLKKMCVVCMLMLLR